VLEGAGGATPEEPRPQGQAATGSFWAGAGRLAGKPKGKGLIPDRASLTLKEFMLIYIR
jgi:hypothetical protein